MLLSCCTKLSDLLWYDDSVCSIRVLLLLLLLLLLYNDCSIRVYFKYLIFSQVYLFSVLFFGMLVGLFYQDIGLSQSIALPKDSYLQDYFDDMSKYFRTGPPVYFVIRGGYDYTHEVNQNKVPLIVVYIM